MIPLESVETLALVVLVVVQLVVVALIPLVILKFVVIGGGNRPSDRSYVSPVSHSSLASFAKEMFMLLTIFW